ncbi:hypothetical protein COT70_02250 [candidate division WWE3 bacterium CG09_land_8_20_14_0_10_47_33]|uniref:PD-(D/E)XK endonuclease-like domain-containing protein n=1 Tax=candidate division WWE3 bacterium CG_4_9_14_0_2_um_filter_48_10 TaxID=1975078 RepID=A0A2M8EK38_UNCKA|nr:MAG: hypothetical protein COT70_02250 [candidate division WWE3 bacterium CG09_land_8_20_14_0_10_47_33]PIZ41063.1 MAG: hypothetical protein COY35_01160 [candidate division WWE3 bacterium CG_4_10_14_0_2_um_filter_47_8]PJC23095.1 MAG: hypothetical protein CO059_00610 [candidate division WWE3 bacterium CG_4_9_14_0_2_um_filter_48_10]PJE51938.1 MAG: hypothetical protein COV28_01335 [candidate division WWE3 bacterium CG10_big_fil_rev_8_21_14_0_10_48_23]
MKKRQSYSPYSIGLYVKCPRQYYFEYLDNYTSVYPNKQKIKQLQVEAGKRKELVFGDLLHRVLNLFFRMRQVERSEEKLLALLKEVWAGGKSEARGKQGGFPEIEEERGWYQKGLEILKEFARTQNLSPTLAYLPEIEKEGEFVEANFLKVPLQPDVVLAGKIDRIDKEGGGFHLIDYKTGESERDDDFQLMVYSILAEEALGKPPTKASYLYLRSGNLRSFQPGEEAKSRAKARALEIAEQIRSEKEFSPHPTKICWWCNYLEFCPAKEEAKRIIAEYKGGEPKELPF